MFWRVTYNNIVTCKNFKPVNVMTGDLNVWTSNQLSTNEHEITELYHGNFILLIIGRRYKILLINNWGSCGHMVVGFITTYAIGANHH